MTMTFVLTPQLHYNTIIEPRAHFLLSLIEDFSIDFPSHILRVYYRGLSRHNYM